MGPLTVDMGGTFTDAVYLDEASGTLRTAKALTRASDFVASLLDVIDRLAVRPEEVSYFAFGSTVAINAILERTGARTALVTTAGFRDVLETDRGNRPDLYNFRYRKPRPFVPRALCFEVRERLDARGATVTPLDLDDVDQVARRCREEGVEAIAIQFLHSYAAPRHEAQAAARLRDLCPGIAVTASHEICREWGEYERASTAVFNAYLQPVVRRQLEGVERALKERGFRCPLFALQSNGGIASFADAIRHPVSLLEAGPSAGINGAAYLGEACGEGKILYLDVGGTTAKCSIIDAYQPRITGQYWIGRSRECPGYPVKVPVVDVVEIPVGGGSVGWIDEGGSLRVGPRSAGADPGPACYGRGGSEPTLTDANLVASRIRADYFADGRLTLDMGVARAAMETLGRPLGLDAEAVAGAMLRVGEAAVINALKLVSVQRGHDPRDFVMLVAGGCGPLHAARLGQELGVREIIVPRHPGYASAFGMLVTQPRRDFVRTLPRAAETVDAALLPGIFATLEAEARDAFAGLPEIAVSELFFEYRVDLRYVGQQHCLTLRLDSAEDRPADLARRFAEAHERAFTFELDGHPVEFVAYRLSASVEAVRPPLTHPRRGSQSMEAALQGERLVEIPGQGWQKVRVFTRDLLPVALECAGPALVEEASTTTLVLPGQRLFIDEAGLLHILPAEVSS
ncbi:hydantoinase/oxoprolinase family protein [Methylobacterium organophilum]|uniref:hydantoinase/oxoprolinase family protein n=1 Tax=Methylobacterium organophilum TaxID=410 RepID=UPI001F14357F|nr:hydantoinase/oxoprolinase family protein [Methylobacterium organophilum]UMY16340.1 hydantoinase/oxoprolinase family protein [Methylobacterium organophilum]